MDENVENEPKEPIPDVLGNLIDPPTLGEQIYADIWLQLLVCVLLLVFTAVPFYFYLRKNKVRRDALMVGLSDSGKTLLFTRLFNANLYVQTYTSLKENVDIYEKSTGGRFRLIDIPGNERLRLKHFDEWKSYAAGIIFVIDSSTIQKDIRDVAEFLYMILTDNEIASSRPNILILCNKQDVVTAKASSAVSTMLQKELNLLRTTKGNQLDSIDSGKNQTGSILGKPDKEIEWSQLPYRITFGESTAVFGKDEDRLADLDQLTKWLDKL